MTPLVLGVRVPVPTGHASFAVLEALAWGELETTRARRTLEHLRCCPRCRQRLGWIRRLPAALERATRVIPRKDAGAVLARRARGDRVILPAGGAVDRGPDRGRPEDPGRGSR